MLKCLRFHHIGYAVSSIAATSKVFVNAGYHAGDVIKDSIQQTLICFLEKEGHPRVELVESAGETASVNKILKNNPLLTGGGGGYLIIFVMKRMILTRRLTLCFWTNGRPYSGLLKRRRWPGNVYAIFTKRKPGLLKLPGGNAVWP